MRGAPRRAVPRRSGAKGEAMNERGTWIREWVTAIDVPAGPVGSVLQPPILNAGAWAIQRLRVARCEPEPRGCFSIIVRSPDRPAIRAFSAPLIALEDGGWFTLGEPIQIEQDTVNIVADFPITLALTGKALCRVQP